MLKNYLKIALRNARRQGGITLLNIIAWPVAYYVMTKWLENFAYRDEMGLSAFLISALLALVAAFLTVSYQAVKAASANPVEALRAK